MLVPIILGSQGPYVFQIWILYVRGQEYPRIALQSRILTDLLSLNTDDPLGDDRMKTRVE